MVFLKCHLWNVSEGSGFENFTKSKVIVAHLSINHRYIIILKGRCSGNGDVVLFQDAHVSLITFNNFPRQDLIF